MMDLDEDVIISENEIQYWNFCDKCIRTFQIENSTFFIAKDVSVSLGYKNAWNLTQSLDSDEISKCTVPTDGGLQKMVIITEPGLYHAIFISRKKTAKDFRRWVTNEILPVLRKAGNYPFFDSNHFTNEV